MLKHELFTVINRLVTYCCVVSYANGDKNLGIFKLTEPEFSVQIPKPSSVVSPVTVEIHTTILTSLKHLQLYRTHHHRHHHHEKHRSCYKMHSNITLTFDYNVSQKYSALFFE